jgi:hypothetical protein
MTVESKLRILINFINTNVHRKILLPRNPDMQEQHFQTRLKLKDLYPRKLLKIR